jgi:hypothetical protein
MVDDGVALEKNKSLEDWLRDQQSECFPPVSHSEIAYLQRYEEIKRVLIPIHETVEKAAMAAGAIDWMNQSTEIISQVTDMAERKEKLDKLKQSDPVVYLNNHGKGHVDKVISKVSEMLHFFDRGYLTPYEGFLLLCAIQIHDIGNFFGRTDHERRCQEILEEKAKTIIPDKIERKVIEKLALVHGGAFNGEKDTINFLSPNKKLHDRKVRKKLLAALLRFGDELADDASRADREGLEKDIIPEGSRIYHHYSQALHTVQISKEEGRLLLNLAFDFDSALAGQQFTKFGENKYLLDEIYDRTLKMERERRYCMRFLRPSFSLDAIRVEIIIQNSNNLFQSDKIQYTLEERGYPSDPTPGDIKSFIPDILTGKEQMKYLNDKWNRI